MLNYSKCYFSTLKSKKNHSMCCLSISIVAYHCSNATYFFTDFFSPLKPFPSHTVIPLSSPFLKPRWVLWHGSQVATKSVTPQRSASPLTIFESASRVAPPTKLHQERPQDQPSQWQWITPRSTPPSSAFKSTRAHIKNTSLLPLRRVKRSSTSPIWVLGSKMVTGCRDGAKFCFMFLFCF